MTRDELIGKLQALGSGETEVQIEGCCGHCVQDLDSVELDEDRIELKANLP